MGRKEFIMSTTNTAARTWGQAFGDLKAWSGLQMQALKKRLPTRKQVGYGVVAIICVLVGLGYLGSSTPEPTAIVEVTRTRLAPLAAADDGVVKMSVAARNGVDAGFDAVAAYLGW
jgi:hypothetical protein